MSAAACHFRDELLERFLRYVRIETTADETSQTVPSTMSQLDLSRLLLAECEAMGLADTSMTPHGVVMATVPATIPDGAGGKKLPAIAWIAHVDTSPEYSGKNVQPIVHRHYDGRDIHLPADPRQVHRPFEQPELAAALGHTIITTDGSTLLGGDDKGGVAVIMQAARELMRSELPHGPIRLCFTCDEEIGRGTDHLDLAALDCICGYTLDGGGQGVVDNETFSADQAVITVKGVNTHPSVGKGVMVNAIRILSELISRLPKLAVSPETTDGRDGFIHPYHIEGGVAEASARLILRDFETSGLEAQARILQSIAESLKVEYPRATIEIAIHPQYRNMRDGLAKEPKAVPKALAAMKAAGIEPTLSIIRGGTDGSLLTAKGLPCPNLSTGQHNPHSPLEWASLDEMEVAVKVLIQLAIEWGKLE
ncbi:peptidase T [Planctopirus hydrillae]|uniref:Peptidase T n=1 Tax=Planctopirus hydrillae TaxID=1841610 RepID=A0A1C3EJE6_9PLAN|nr:peptidase T [Planctopirus hydrillae]ODA33344.1 peptidase T [Planctopirus hydrillae]